MYINFLGHGAAADHQLINSALLVEDKQVRLLVDCGYNVYGHLKELGLFRSLTHVFITHLHVDHCGSLANLLYYRKAECAPLTLLFADPQQQELVISWLNYMLPHPERFVNIALIEEQLPWASVIDSTGYHVKDYRSYGLIFTNSEGESTVFSGDLGDPTFIQTQVKKRKLAPKVIYHDVSFSRSEGHTYYQDLQAVSMDCEVVGYHNNPQQKPADCTLRLIGE